MPVLSVLEQSNPAKSLTPAIVYRLMSLKGIRGCRALYSGQNLTINRGGHNVRVQGGHRSSQP